MYAMKIAIEYLETGWNAATSPMVAHGVIGLGTTTGIDAIKYYFAKVAISKLNMLIYWIKGPVFELKITFKTNFI